MENDKPDFTEKVFTGFKISSVQIFAAIIFIKFMPDTDKNTDPLPFMLAITGVFALSHVAASYALDFFNKMGD